MKKAQQKDDSCKKTKPTKHRHDDPDKDDEPKAQKKRRRTSETSSKPPPAKTTSAHNKVTSMKSTEDSQQQSVENLEFEETTNLSPQDQPIHINEPPMDAPVVPQHEWIDQSATACSWFDEMLDAHPDIPRVKSTS